MIFNLTFSFPLNFGLYAVSNFFVLRTTEKSRLLWCLLMCSAEGGWVIDKLNFRSTLDMIF